MIDLTLSARGTPRIHQTPADPGVTWSRDASIAVDAPPDDDLNPAPETTWPHDTPRTGLCGAVTPRVWALPDGRYRMYYTQILPRAGFPAGANDYETSTCRILSAVSTDAKLWTPEAGVRLSSQQGGAGDCRVVCGSVTPTLDGRQLRMYYECCLGPHAMQNSIRSAVSTDGLAWQAEEGVRLEVAGGNLASPRLIYLQDGRCRLYCCARDHGIISAISTDGVRFQQEPGIRIALGGIHDALTAFAPEIVQPEGRGYVMYYAGYAAANRAYILRAESDDGIVWKKSPEPVLAPGGRWDAAKCSEMCVVTLPPRAGTRPCYRIFYEACDGTAIDERGVWRIACATSVS